MDPLGTNDARMHQSNEDIYQKVVLAAIEAGISMIKIIVTLSLDNDTMDLVSRSSASRRAAPLR